MKTFAAYGSLKLAFTVSVLGLLGSLGCVQVNRPTPTSTATTPTPTTPTPAAVTPTPAATAGVRDTLYANLYIQTSAEYAALCRQTYNAALGFVRAEAAKAKEAAPDTAKPMRDGKPLAVVLDLDETVLENGVFQTVMLDRGVGFSEALFDEVVSKYADQIVLVPGAGEFLSELRKLGVTPVFITNRGVKLRAATVASLKANSVECAGLDADDSAELLMKSDTSDKQPRRDATDAKFAVVAYVGDQLTDFPGPFRVGKDSIPSVEARRAEVAKVAEKWNAGYFILPNPAYGEWTKLWGKSAPESLLRRAK